MKNIIKKAVLFSLAAVTLGLATAPAWAYVNVRGYTRSDGTYVAPHIRSNPDGNPYNNFSNW